MWSYTHPAMHLLAALQRRKLGISGAVTMGEGGDVEEKISFQAWTTQIELISFFIFFLNVSFSFFFLFNQLGPTGMCHNASLWCTLLGYIILCSMQLLTVPGRDVFSDFVSQ